MPLCRHLAALHPRACRPCVLNGCPPPPQPVQARWAAAEFPPAPPLDGYPRSARPASRPVRRQVLPRVRHPARPVAASAAAWTRAAGSRRASACPTQTLSGKHQRGGGRAARAVESTRSACDLAYCDGVSCGLSARISATSAHEDRAIVAGAPHELASEHAQTAGRRVACAPSLGMCVQARPDDCARPHTCGGRLDVGRSSTRRRLRRSASARTTAPRSCRLGYTSRLKFCRRARSSSASRACPGPCPRSPALPPPLNPFAGPPRFPHAWCRWADGDNGRAQCRRRPEADAAADA